MFMPRVHVHCLHPVSSPRLGEPAAECCVCEAADAMYYAGVLQRWHATECD